MLFHLICSTASIGVVQRWIIPKEQEMYRVLLSEMFLMQNCQLHICKNIQYAGFCWALELQRLNIKVKMTDKYIFV